MASLPRTVQAVVGKLVKFAERTPDLKTVSKIEISMCPWDKNSTSTKQVWSNVSGEDVRDTNRKCIINTKMEHNGSEPVVKVEFNDGEKLLLKGAYLTWTEMMYHFNAFCVNKEEAAKDQPLKLF